MRAAQQTTKIIHLCLKTVKSGSNKGSLPIDPIHGERQCQLPPLEGSLAQARSRLAEDPGILSVQTGTHYEHSKGHQFANESSSFFKDSLNGDLVILELTVKTSAGLFPIWNRLKLFKRNRGLKGF